MSRFLLTLSSLDAALRLQEMCVYCFDTLVSHYKRQAVPPPAFADATWCVRDTLAHPKRWSATLPASSRTRDSSQRLVRRRCCSRASLGCDAPSLNLVCWNRLTVPPPLQPPLRDLDKDDARKRRGEAEGLHRLSIASHAAQRARRVRAHEVRKWHPARRDGRSAAPGPPQIPAREPPAGAAELLLLSHTQAACGIAPAGSHAALRSAPIPTVAQLAPRPKVQPSRGKRARPRTTTRRTPPSRRSHRGAARAAPALTRAP